MTVLVTVGRRVPRGWFRRGAQRIKGLVTFQENIWQMISQSFNLAKKKDIADGRMRWIITREKESEDIHYQIEWIKNTIH